MRIRLIMLAIVVVASLATFSGCSDQTCVGCDELILPPLDPYRFPDTPDKLVANLQFAYETMDFDGLARLQHPQSVILLQPGTTATYPGLGSSLDLVESLRIHQRMLSRQDVLDPNGVVVPGVQSIMFQTLMRQGAWSISAVDDPIPSTQHALHVVTILLDRGASLPALHVTGSLQLYVVARDSVVDAVTKPYYTLRGVADLTDDTPPAGKSALVQAWGRVLAMFR